MSIKISQLLETVNVGVNDSIPIARGSQETFRTPARQFVTTANNIGVGPGQFFSLKTGTIPTALQFRTLSATGENLAIETVGDTVVISSSAQNPVKTSFIANGATRIWPLVGFNSINAANYRVDFDGVLQEPFIDYNLSANNIAFTIAPPLSTKVVIVSNNMVRVNEAQPAPNTITNAMMTDSSIGTAQLSSGAVTTDKIALSAIGPAQLSAQAVTTLTIANSAITAEKMSGGQTGNAPVYGCRAWVNFNGTTTPPTIRSSGNVLSVNRIGTGVFTVNFTTAMPISSFAYNITGRSATGANTSIPWAYATTPPPTTASITCAFVNMGGGGSTYTLVDPIDACVTIFC
jgi:hypothetical protein